VKKKEIIKDIYVATPAYGGMVYSGYLHSLLKLQMMCMDKKIGMSYSSVTNESLITRARNTCVAEFLDNEKKPNYLMFIDADVQFDPGTIKRMLDYDKEVVCGIYPKKHINWDYVYKLTEEHRKNKIKDRDLLFALSLEYNLNFKDPLNVKIQNGFVEVLDGPTGFMLIKRKVFEKMRKAYPELHYKTDQIINSKKYKSKNTWAFFDTMIDEDRRYLSEDYAFCRLWQKIGGKIYADITAPLTHWGTYAFKGHIGTRFKSKKDYYATNKSKLPARNK
jgi:glycosyltransferase involved in cell wall biosynthesis